MDDEICSSLPSLLVLFIKMHGKLLSVLLGSAVLAAPSQAVNLFVADYGGNLSTLSLTETAKGYDLSVTSKTTDCSPGPNWLTLDKPNNVLYCLDRGLNFQPPGSLNSFTIGDKGVLKRVSRVKSIVGGAVAGEIITGANGKRGYFSAS
jgi:hypothetical protein